MVSLGQTTQHQDSSVRQMGLYLTWVAFIRMTYKGDAQDNTLKDALP